MDSVWMGKLEESPFGKCVLRKARLALHDGNFGLSKSFGNSDMFGLIFIFLACFLNLFNCCLLETSAVSCGQTAWAWWPICWKDPRSINGLFGQFREHSELSTITYDTPGVPHPTHRSDKNGGVGAER